MKKVVICKGEVECINENGVQASFKTSASVDEIANFFRVLDIPTITGISESESDSNEN